MDKTYQPHEIESKIYQQWEQSSAFAPSGEGNPYSIMIPPPNVTGFLHMGHGFQDTLMDALTRYHRMCGDNTLWQPGTDHAGIATQMVVERQLAAEGISRHDLGREKFVEKIWDWKHTSGNNITQQIRRLGASVDWSRERFTMDEGLCQAVKDVFIQLYDEGLIYRGKRLVNWDPKFHTAISDLEVLNEEEDGHLWHIRYPIVDSDESVVVATTRPETLLGDAAVAVHPDDERYQHLIGKHALLPLTDRTIPIIADDYVEPDFGSGCVKITPAHDFNDNAVGARHNLPLINILTQEATLNENVPSDYQGMDRFDARKKIIEDLTALGLLVKTEPHTLKVPRGDRSGVIIEPLLTDQWYVKMQPLAEPAIKVVKEGKVRFIPENYSKTYFQWLENIEDWCISRQLWWGHRIPAWYDEEHNIYVGQNETDVRQKYKLNDDITLKQDDDVLDTWFSSALWPFSTLGYPEKSPELETFYPTSTLVSGFDIIFFWIARMIMMGLKFMGDIPFKDIYITGLIRDSHGHKMSKSKGNVLDPIDLIDGIDLESLVEKRTQNMMQEHVTKKIEKDTRNEFPDGIPPSGCDALRFTFCAIASNTRNLRFDLARLEGYRNFCNKLWNATRFVLMNVENAEIDLHGDDISFSLADRWITSQLQRTIETIHHHFAQYRFDLLAHALYEFTWNEYCDWYLELCKVTLYSKTASDAEKRGALRTLLTTLETILRLMHPIMPFITEEIWQNLKPLLKLNGDSIMTAKYPNSNDASVDSEAEACIELLKKMITGLRTIRAEMNIKPSQKIPLYIAQAFEEQQQLISTLQPLLSGLANVETLHFVSNTEEKPLAATAVVGDMELLIPLARLIDKEAEMARLQRELGKLEKELTKLDKKLSNESFVQKAPETVIAKVTAERQSYQATYDKLTQQIVKIKSL